MQVINQGRVNFQYKASPISPIIIETALSNTVSTDIINDMLKVEKKVDKLVANVFDSITYTIVITNISNEYIENVFFQDLIPEGTKFINNSIEISGEKKRCINPSDGFSIGIIAPKISLSISFKVVVLPLQSIDTISNYSDITYDYIYNVEMPPLRITIETNKASTFIQNNLFKQFNISKVFKFPYSFPLIDSVIDVNVKINALNTKIVGTPIIYTDTHKEPDLCKLIVIGSIEYTLLYKYKYNREKQYRIRKIIDLDGFSNFILVPCGIQYCEVNDFNIIIENVEFEVLNEKCVFVDTEILMNLKN